MKHSLHLGDCMKVLPQLEAKSIDCAISSPPYWGLRYYGEQAKTIWDGNSTCQHDFNTVEHKFGRSGLVTGAGEGDVKARLEHIEDESGFHAVDLKSSSDVCSKCQAWRGQLGLEPDFNQYVNHIAQVFREVKRVLKDTGSLWLNMGDTYAGGWGAEGKPEDWEDLHTRHKEKYPLKSVTKHATLPAKCLIEIPSRVVLRLIDGEGWILRNRIVWYKRNHMPSSVKDRLANSHEYIFHLVKQQRYYYDLDGIREPHQSADGNKRFNIRVRDAQKGRLEQKWGGLYDASPEEVAKYDEAEYGGKFAEVDPELAERFNSPRARTQRQAAIQQKIGDAHQGKSTAGLYDPERLSFYHEKGKNPGDVQGFPLNPPHTSYGTRRALTGSMYPSDLPGHPEGKNPGDVVEDHKMANVPGPYTRQSMSLVPSHQGDSGNPDGKNPGDVVQTEGIFQIGTRGFAGLTATGEYANRKYAVDEDFFSNIDTEEKAYWLGFLLADGYIDDGYALDISLASRDEGHLYRLKESMRSEHPVFHRDEARVRLVIGSKRLVAGLGKWWSHDRLPSITHQLMRHFVRGVFDGDGTVSFYHTGSYLRWTAAILGEEPFLQELAILLREANVPVTGIYRRHGISELAIASHEGIAKLHPFLYENASIYLQRKEMRFPQSLNFEPDMFDITTTPFSEAHFATFPEEICVRPIKATCPPNGTVLDPFSGSGTVAKVARDLGKNSVSIELNPEYERLWHLRLGTATKAFDVEYVVVK